MFSGLTSINLPPDSETKIPPGRDYFLLKTCQRTLVLGLGDNPLRPLPLPSLCQATTVHREQRAYGLALEVLCGLQSKIPAESEVASQFKQAYRQYATREDRNPLILSLLEELLKDAKRIRSRHLGSVGGHGYPAIARQILLAHLRRHPQTEKRVLIKGTGALAESLARTLKKCATPFVVGRDTSKARQLAAKVGAETVDWRDRAEQAGFPLILNTIGADTPLFGQDFFSPWKQKHPHPLYVDLGAPSVLQTSLTQADGVWRLEDIFERGKRLTDQSREKLASARQAIDRLSRKRYSSFDCNYPFGWEELQFCQ